MRETRNGATYPNVGERYRIEGLLGEGAMARVYRAFDHLLQRPVALKVLRPNRLKSKKYARRMITEAQATARLNHPNIVTIYDIGQEDGVDFIAMEFVAGKTLDELILTLGEMVQYKNLDPRDPMNSRAASWALRHKHVFPVDERELKGMSLSDQIVIGSSEEDDDLGINLL